MMDVIDVSALVRDVIETGHLSWARLLVQDSGQVWRVTLRGQRQCLGSVDVPKGLSDHVGDVVRKYLNPSPNRFQHVDGRSRPYRC